MRKTPTTVRRISTWRPVPEETVLTKRPSHPLHPNRATCMPKKQREGQRQSICTHGPRGTVVVSSGRLVGSARANAIERMSDGGHQWR